jgi:hypothetical protein
MARFFRGDSVREYVNGQQHIAGLDRVTILQSADRTRGSFGGVNRRTGSAVADVDGVYVSAVPAPEVSDPDMGRVNRQQAMVSGHRPVAHVVRNMKLTIFCAAQDTAAWSVEDKCLARCEAVQGR